MIAEFDIVPIDENSSMSNSISKVVDRIDKSGLEYQLTSMGTIIEGEWKDIIHLIKDCRDELIKQVDRVIIHITIDDRKGYKNRIKEKISSVENKLGREIKK